MTHSKGQESYQQNREQRSDTLTSTSMSVRERFTRVLFVVVCGCNLNSLYTYSLRQHSC